MKFLLINCLVLIFVDIIYGQKNNKRECNSVNKADHCMQKLLLIGDPTFKFPVNKQEMDRHCRSVTSTEKCIKDYSQKCLDTFPRQVTGVLAFGVAKTNKGYCGNQRRKDTFISIAECANSKKPEIDGFMFDYIDAIQGIENLDNNKMKIPLMCCNFYKLKNNILDLARDVGAPKCTQQSITEIERIIDGYSDEVLNLICPTDYSEESDKCSAILSQTPKKKSSQKRPKSMLIPFSNVLGSV